MKKQAGARFVAIDQGKMNVRQSNGESCKKSDLLRVSAGVVKRVKPRRCNELYRGK